MKNDFFEEKFFQLLLEKPWLIIWYVLQHNGFLQLKHRLLDGYSPKYDLGFLYNQLLIDWIKENRIHYQHIQLISASPDLFVKRIAEPLAIFDNIHGSLNNNLKGIKKLSFIQELGLTYFDYIGDSTADQPIFNAAEHAYLIKSNEIKKLK